MIAPTFLCKQEDSWAAKLLALARWATAHNYRVIVEQAQGTTFAPLQTTTGFWSAIFLADGKKLAVVLSSNGGVDFGQSQGESWVSATPDAGVKNKVLGQLVTSATLAEQAADAALAGDLEGAHALAEQSAQAMTGEINFTELPALADVPIPPDPVAYAALCVEVVAATDDNVTALQTAQADQQHAAAIEQQSPAEAAQLRESAANRQRIANEHLQALRETLAAAQEHPDRTNELVVALREGSLWSIPTSGPSTGPTQPSTYPEAPARSLREQWLAELAVLRAEVQRTQEALRRLDKSMQSDQEQRKEWEKTTSDAYGRALEAHEPATVLLVDDEPAVTSSGREILEYFGYDVFAAANGEEAVDLFRDHHQEMDLVILDLVMPRMNGEQCLNELLRIAPEVTVVIATGYTIDSDTHQRLEPNVKSFLHKPFTATRLLSAVRGVLEHSV